VNNVRQTSTRAWIFVLTSLASFMVALDALVVSTALGTIRADLGASIEQLEWTVNSYTLSFAVLLMTGAALGDRFGRRRVYTAGVGVFVAASAACALAPSIGWLIAARTIQGCGAALVMPLAVTQLSVAFPPEQRARALGAFSGVTALAVLLGPAIGGAIAGGLAWQWIFWLNVPIGLVIMPFILRRLPESFGPRTALDIGGLLLITGAALGVMWGLIRGNSAGWSSPEVVGIAAAGVLLAAGFVAWERRTAAPMLPLRLFRARAFAAGNAAGFLFFASLYGATFFLAQFLQIVLGYGPLGAGLGLLPWTAMLFLCAPLAGVLISRFGERALLIGGLVLQAAAMAWIGLIAGPGMAYSELVAPLMIAGFGAAVIPASQNAVVGSVAPSEIGKASGIFNMLRQLGAAFGVAILAAVFAQAGSFGTAQTFVDGFAPAMEVCAGLSFLGAAVGMALPGRRMRAIVPAKASA
jgi:EmrB/QacA subfamily drug resistance transporter